MRIKRVSGVAVFSFMIACCSLLFVGDLHAAYQLGVVLPLSGEFEKIGKNLLHAAELSAEKIARDKGIQLKLVVKDDKNEPREAERVARELASDPALIGVIGHYYSSAALGAAPVYDAARIPALCIAASDRNVGKSGPYVFSMYYSNEKQAEMMAAHLTRVFRKKNVLMISSKDRFGTTLRDAFQAKAGRLGIRIAKRLEHDQAGPLAADFIASALPDRRENQQFDAVVVMSHAPQGLKLVKQLRKQGIRAMIMGPDSFNSPDFLDERLISEEDTKDVFVASPFLWEMGNDRALKFRREFRRTSGQEPHISAAACSDAVLMFASAIEKGNNDRKKIRDYFASLKWQTAVSGITGELFFNKEDRMMDRDVFLTEIKDGRFKVNYVQLTEPHEPYVFKEKKERLAKGYLVELDNRIYQWVDVVFVGLDFFRINDVNLQKMAFDAEFFLWFKWMSDKINVEEITILNASASSRALLKEDLGASVKYRAYRCKGSYVNSFNLEYFPFDRQSLPVTLGHKSKNSTHVMLVVDSRHMAFDPVQEIYPQEWTYVNKEHDAGMHRFDSTYGDPDYRLGKGYKSKIYFSTATVSVTLKRIILPYLFNTFLPLLVILLITVFIFRIPVEQFALRFNLSMTSLLSVLVYHLTQKSALPRIGYLMALDYYFIVAYMFVLTLIAFNVFAMTRVLEEKIEATQQLNNLFMKIFFPATIMVYTILSAYFAMIAQT